MKKGLILLLIGAMLSQCATVPITGRKQAKLLPTGELNSLALTEYDSFKQNEKILPDTDERVKMVREIGNNIADAVERFMLANHMSDRLKDFNWEFNVAEQDVLNAWCMPGGKVMFYTGILPVCDGVGGIATVMGHEIAHAVARHGNERMSQAMIVQGAGMSLSAMTEQQPELVHALAMGAFGIGSQVGMLSYSRLHESEADKMGLVFMIMAGYDANESIDFWSRMAANKNGAAPPEFLSTHPHDDTRIKDIKDFIPEATSLAEKYK